MSLCINHRKRSVCPRIYLVSKHWYYAIPFIRKGSWFEVRRSHSTVVSSGALAGWLRSKYPKFRGCLTSSSPSSKALQTQSKIVSFQCIWSLLATLVAWPGGSIFYLRIRITWVWVQRVGEFLKPNFSNVCLRTLKWKIAFFLGLCLKR